MDPEVRWPDDQTREIAAGIDREADWLNRLVSNLLDMSRIEAGELKPSLAALDVADLVEGAIARSTAGHDRRDIRVDTPIDLPPVLADEIFLGQILANIIDNAAKYAGPGAPIAVSARGDRRWAGPRLRSTMAGPVSRPRRCRACSRSSTASRGEARDPVAARGSASSVVRGLAEAMGGSVAARPSPFGGLAIDVVLRAAPAEVVA